MGLYGLEYHVTIFSQSAACLILKKIGFPFLTITRFPENWRLFGQTGMVKEMIVPMLKVAPAIILTISTAVMVVVWITAVFPGVVDHLAIEDPLPGDWVSAVITDIDVGVLHSLFGNYDTHGLVPHLSERVSHTTILPMASLT
jgi:hypothetical protein